jgi:hypothetical protein
LDQAGLHVEHAGASRGAVVVNGEGPVPQRPGRPHGVQVPEYQHGRVRSGPQQVRQVVNHPDLAAEWDAAVNGDLPQDLTAGSHRESVGPVVRSAPRRRLAQHLSVARQGEGSPSAKLTAAEVAAIRTDPRRNVDVARSYGVTATTIYAIRTGRSWRGDHPADDRPDA